MAAITFPRQVSGWKNGKALPQHHRIQRAKLVARVITADADPNKTICDRRAAKRAFGND